MRQAGGGHSSIRAKNNEPVAKRNADKCQLHDGAHPAKQLIALRYCIYVFRITLP
jgi:hypothetical protein